MKTIDHTTRTMDGLPVKDAMIGVEIVVSEENVEKGIPADAESRMISLALRRQLAAPFAHVLRCRAYAALPDKSGVPIPGRRGRWTMFRWALSPSTRQKVIEVDLGILTDYPIRVTLSPVSPTERPAQKAKRDREYHKKGGRRSASGGQDALTKAGVRNYSGHTPR